MTCLAYFYRQIPQPSLLSSFFQLEHRPQLLGLCLFVLLTVNSCANNPYIKNTRPASSSEQRSALQPGTLDYALAYADDTYDAYQNKLPEEFLRQQLLSTGLIATGATVLGLSAFGAPSAGIFGAALGGAGTYQLGTWNSNQARLGIYLEGMKALTCSKSAITPLRLSNNTTADLRSRLSTLDRTLNKTASAAGRLTGAIVLANIYLPSTPGIVSTAEAELTQTQAVFNQANDLLFRATTFARRIDQAGSLLESAIDDIRKLIDQAIGGTLADLSKLPALINGIYSFATVFGPLPPLAGSTSQTKLDATKTKDNAKGTAQSGLLDDLLQLPSGTKAVPDTASVQLALANALGEMIAQRRTLEAEIAALKGLIDSPSMEEIRTSLKSCGVDAAQLKTAITLDRSILTFQAGIAQESTVTINGSDINYFWELLDSPAKGIEIKLPPGSRTLTVKASDQTEAGRSYEIRISDTGKNTTRLTIKIDPKKDGQTEAKADAVAQPSRSATAGAVCMGTATLSREEVCLVQRVVGASVDGTFGSETCMKLQTSWHGLLGYPAQTAFVPSFNDETFTRIKRAAGLPGSKRGEQIESITSSGLGCDGKSLKSSIPNTQPNASHLPTSSTIIDPTKCRNTSTDIRNSFECSAHPDQIKIWRAKLKSFRPQLDPANGVFDPDLRNAIADFQKQEGISPADGTLNDRTLTALDSVSK